MSRSKIFEKITPTIDECLNTETFTSLESVKDIPQENLLILDKYAFDVNELKEYAKQSLNKLYKNPHTNSSFTPEAIATLHSHPILGQYCTQLDQRLAEQKREINNETVEKIIGMLLDINKVGIDGSEDPRMKFLEYKSTLTLQEQKNLEDYIIQIPVSKLLLSSNVSGGEARGALMRGSLKKTQQDPEEAATRSLRFSEALVGGSQAAPCVKTLQVFLWKFVLDIKPEAITQLPKEVQAIASAEKYILPTISTSAGENKFSSLSTQGKRPFFTPGLGTIGETSSRSSFGRENKYTGGLAQGKKSPQFAPGLGAINETSSLSSSNSSQDPTIEEGDKNKNDGGFNPRIK